MTPAAIPDRDPGGDTDPGTQTTRIGNPGGDADPETPTTRIGNPDRPDRRPRFRGRSGGNKVKGVDDVGSAMSKQYGSYSTIAHTSEAILELLRDRITERSDVVNVDRNEIELVSPDDVGAESDVRLGLYLYGIQEHRQVDQHHEVEIGGRTERPLALTLQYLMTAYPSTGGNDQTANSIDQQRVLGLAMQVMHQNAIIGKYELPEGMGDNKLSIALERQDIDRIEDLYHSMQDASLHPSVTYFVGPVVISGEDETPKYPSGERTGEWEVSFTPSDT
ncbi:hypothetical protein BRD00_02860 [Halobacteriales archaeon QS_8_69_26]|nr:MAG: hypothetical protein BRD00_02860 [Halobacteriales archaeon QS_8_69_26]